EHDLEHLAVAASETDLCGAGRRRAAEGDDLVREETGVAELVRDLLVQEAGQLGTVGPGDELAEDEIADDGLVLVSEVGVEALDEGVARVLVRHGRAPVLG